MNRFTKHAGGCLALLLIALSALLFVAGSSHPARAFDVNAPSHGAETLTGPPADSGPVLERGWGVFGAWVCAAAASALVHGGMATPAAVPLLSVAVSGCLLAALDVLTTE